MKFLLSTSFPLFLCQIGIVRQNYHLTDKSMKYFMLRVLNKI
jgi:hypothetical protein